MEALTYHDEGAFLDPSVPEISLVDNFFINHVNDYDLEPFNVIQYTFPDGLNRQNYNMDIEDKSFFTEGANFNDLLGDKEDYSKTLVKWDDFVEDFSQPALPEEYQDILDLNLSDMKYEEDKSTFPAYHLQEMTNPVPDLKEKEQKSDITEESTSHTIDYTMKINTSIETEKEIEKEIEDPIVTPAFQKARKPVKKAATTKNNNRNTKGKRRKKENTVIEEPEDIDIETIPDEIPVLEASDVRSLLEQFEASENPNYCNKPAIKNNRVSDTRMSKTVVQECRSSTLDKPASLAPNQQKIIRENTLTKEVIDRIKASGRKKGISIIPAMPNKQGGNRNGRMQNAGATTSRKKVLKTIHPPVKIDAKSASIHLDHDYCSNSGVPKNCDNNKYTKSISILKPNQSKNSSKTKECCNSNNSKKDSGLELTGVCDTNDKSVVLLNKETDQINDISLENSQICQKETPSKQPRFLNESSSIKKVNVSNESSHKTSPIMKIRSALATSILQMRKSSTPRTNNLQTGPRVQQMISVLKNPPNPSQSPFLINNSNESIVTTTNSLNNEVQNIIVQNTQDLTPREEPKNPPRKKLNLAEYRNRRDQNRSDNSRTNSPIQPTILTYVHHASTTTEPIKDNSENLIWSEREITSVLKLKSDLEEEKNKSKPPSREIGIQTYETVFEFPTQSVDTVEEKKMEEEKEEEKRKESARDRKLKSYRRHRFSSSSSRSRSKSRSRRRRNRKSRSRSRNRSRSRSINRSRSRSRSNSRSRSRSRSTSKNTNDTSRSRSRSRSRKRSNTRRRKISHRRSSVSSSSTWSSRTRSYTSRSQYSCSRSRSSRSRSRSSSRYYSSCSRSSSRSNFGRNRWSNHRRDNSNDRERNYDKYRRYSNNCRDYRDWKRSPLHSYHKTPYGNWYNQEKQKQVEERRVIYVGRIDEGVTKADLRRRFEAFGTVVDISLHFRERGDNYGFVTFAYKDDAYEAVEHGNDDPSLPRYDLCFGGRRAFCKSKYADLDDMAGNSPMRRLPHANEENTFDFLLKEAKDKLSKRKV